MSHSDGYTGHLFEEEVLGSCTVSFKGYMRYRDAMELARKNQPARRGRIALELERAVREQTGAPVAFFTSVGTPFDTFHGVDGFFEFEGTAVTVDLTMNPHKDSGKADVIIHREDLDDPAAIAARIARELRARQERSTVWKAA